MSEIDEGAAPRPDWGIKVSHRQAMEGQVLNLEITAEGLANLRQHGTCRIRHQDFTPWPNTGKSAVCEVAVTLNDRHTP